MHLILYATNHHIQVGAGEFLKIIDDVKGPNSLARQEWLKLEEYMKQFVDAAAIFPPCAIREDLGAAATTFARYLPSILNAGPNALQLTSPFSEVIVCCSYVSNSLGRTFQRNLIV